MLSWIAAAVVVELFTSQGCSSCPPADALISQLAKQHANVIPLAFHVDYWDNAFWHDPFSSHQWTERQVMYVRTFGLNSAYTPQAVVNGTQQLVGSNAAAMKAAIDNAARAQAGKLTLDAVREGDAIKATIGGQIPADDEVMLVVFENGITTHVRGGENMGRTAVDDAIVRKLWRVHPGTITMPISPAWKNIGVAAFLQNAKTMAIDAAQSVIPSEAKDLRPPQRKGQAAPGSSF
ncbi:MAG TPA: DUF1223 domain-containing protein [Thermoanaerobaculia bacterium]|nr:DUF1223 domain-containing protein [Thermoanaerobaculia bacterium]